MYKCPKCGVFHGDLPCDPKRIEVRQNERIKELEDKLNSYEPRGHCGVHDGCHPGCGACRKAERRMWSDNERELRDQHKDACRQLNAIITDLRARLAAAETELRSSLFP